MMCPLIDSSSTLTLTYNKLLLFMVNKVVNPCDIISAGYHINDTGNFFYGQKHKPKLIQKQLS